MNTARELYEISKTSNLRIIKNIIKETKEYIIQRVESESNNGFVYSEIWLTRRPIQLKDFLIDGYIKLAKEFENNGYKVSINICENEFGIYFIITLSWNDEIKLCNHGLLVYATGKKINNKKRKKEIRIANE